MLVDVFLKKSVIQVVLFETKADDSLEFLELGVGPI